MRRYLEEHSGAFGPDEIRVLVAAFDKAWESVQASGAIFGKWVSLIVAAFVGNLTDKTQATGV
jgi:hypothetical protein